MITIDKLTISAAREVVEGLPDDESAAFLRDLLVSVDVRDDLRRLVAREVIKTYGVPCTCVTRDREESSHQEDCFVTLFTTRRKEHRAPRGGIS